MQTLDSRTLASYIVAYRYLKINKERAKLAIQILEFRISAGEDFDYNKYCEEEIAKLPILTPIDKLLKTAATAQVGSALDFFKKII